MQRLTLKLHLIHKSNKLDLTSALGFQSRSSCNITCVAKTSNNGGEPGVPPLGEREGGFTITHVTDASGNVVCEYSFDAWGRRRDKDFLLQLLLFFFLCCLLHRFLYFHRFPLKNIIFRKWAKLYFPIKVF